MTSFAKKSLLSGVILFLGLFLFLALRNGVAQLFLLSARSDMDVWVAEKRNPSEAEVATVKSELSWALRIANENSAAHEAMTHISLFHASSIVDEQQRLQVLREGLQAVRIALASNPVSPYLWTNLLLLKRGLGEYDAEFQHALHRAVELGPWEPTAQLAQADVGLSAWSFLSAEEQELVKQVFDRGVGRQRKALLKIEESHRAVACTDEVRCQ